MIELVFKGMSAFGDRTVGPAPAFRIGGNFIRTEPAGKIVARYEAFHWSVENDRFTSYRCEGAATVHFEDMLGGASPEYGPFTDIHCADGVMYCAGALFARFAEESQLWLALPISTHWPALIMQAQTGLRSA